MSKFIQKDKQLNVPQVFDKGRVESEYMIIKKEKFENLMECNKSIEETVAIVERITICVCLIVVGVIIGIILL